MHLSGAFAQRGTQSSGGDVKDSSGRLRGTSTAHKFVLLIVSAPINQQPRFVTLPTSADIMK